MSMKTGFAKAVNEAVGENLYVIPVKLNLFGFKELTFETISSVYCT